MGRWDKIEKASRKRGFVADDEVVQACGVSSGTTIQRPDGTYKRDMQRHALIVTDANVHAIRMGQAGFGSLKETLFSLPRDQVTFRRDGNSLTFSSLDRTNVWTFAGPPLGNGFDNVEAAIADRRAPGA